MRRSSIVYIVAAVVVLVTAAAAVWAVRPAHHDRPRPVLGQHDAERLLDRYRLDTVARLPAAAHFTEAATNLVPCKDSGVIVNATYDLLVAGAAAGPDAVFQALRQYWAGRKYAIVNDTARTGLTRQLLVENPADGVRVGLTQRTGRALRLTVSSPCAVAAGPLVAPIALADLTAPQRAYQDYVAGQVVLLTAQVAALRAAIAGGDLDRARALWLPAQLTWEHLGAAYDSFGELAEAIDGLPGADFTGLPGADFAGLHRIEYALWHGETGAPVLAAADALVGDVAALTARLPQLTANPADLPLRAHEILEDALRDHLSGRTDQGSGADFAETYADLQVTGVVLDQLAPLLDPRRPELMPTARRDLAAAQQALLATAPGGVWTTASAVPQPARERVDATVGALLEVLAPVPDLLETPTS